MDEADRLAEGFSEEKLAGFLARKSSAFGRMGLALQPDSQFVNARLVGVLKYAGSPLAVVTAGLPPGAALGERSSRRRQYEFARRTLQRFIETPPVPNAGGLFAQGLFAFHDEAGRFRLSLVTARPEGHRLVFSSFRRQSFYVDPARGNVTFRKRLSLDWSTFEAVKEAFSVETLTKEFYTRLFQWFETACSNKAIEFPNDIDTDNDNTKKIQEHLIRLITRLMFVWFLKQKGLIPDNLFDEAKLADILADFQPQSESQGVYYNAILQNLFFATLNSEERRCMRPNNGATNPDHGVKTVYRYQEMFKGPSREVREKAILALFDGIPFLNGGLFECLDQEDRDNPKLPVMYYDGFSNEEHHPKHAGLMRARLPNAVFFNSETGLLPLLKQYDFTVDENAPGDEEVALDPELLGKVFENLLASVNHDAKNLKTEKQDRKRTGSFYTPREIVSFMVDESLIAYLAEKCGSAGEQAIRSLVTEEAATVPSALAGQIQQALQDVKILDPACGSGAFPMGALTRIVDILGKIGAVDLSNAHQVYTAKLHLIQNCIFGVDIQPIAVQISKLRCFISLLCDQSKDDAKANEGIEILPNLETKFIAANSLVGLKGVKTEEGTITIQDFFGDENPTIREKKDALWALRRDYFSCKTRQEKKDIWKKDAALRKELAELSRQNGYSASDAEMMAAWDPYNQNASSPFFDSKWMFNIKDGFNVVIGNPPWGIDVSSEETICMNGDSPADSSEVFIKYCSAKFCQQGTLFSFIIPKSILFAKNWAVSRNVLLNNQLIWLADAGLIFENVNLESVAFVVKMQSDNTSIVRRLQFIPLKPYCPEKTPRLLTPVTQDSMRINGVLNLADVSILDKEILHKVEGMCIRLASIKRQVFRGIYISDSDKAERLDHGNWSFVNKVPDVGKYLIRKIHKLDLPQNLFSKAERLNHDRIIIKVLRGSTLTCTFVTRNLLTTEKLVNLIITDSRFNPLYILGILNSRLTSFFLQKELFSDITETARIMDDFYIALAPIFPCSKTKQEKIILRVDQILAAKKENPEADTSALEAEIDQLVYQLYGLTAEEIAVVEGSEQKPALDAEKTTPAKRGRKAKVAEKTGFEGFD